MITVAESRNGRRKYIGVGGDDAPSLGVLEADILRIIWDAGEPQSSVQVYQTMTLHRKDEQREMQSPSTIAVTLSRMVEKGLLHVQRRPNAGKGYYGPTRSRAEVVSEVLDDASRRLTGKKIGCLLAAMLTPSNPVPLDIADALPENDSSLEPLIEELRRRQNDSDEGIEKKNSDFAVVKNRD